MQGIYTYIPETNCVPREYSVIIIIIIMIIIIIISFMQGIYTYIPETNCVPREYSVSAILVTEEVQYVGCGNPHDHIVIPYTPVASCIFCLQCVFV